jgi:hypothetical protein
MNIHEKSDSIWGMLPNIKFNVVYILVSSAEIFRFK